MPAVMRPVTAAITPSPTCTATTRPRTAATTAVTMAWSWPSKLSPKAERICQNAPTAARMTAGSRPSTLPIFMVPSEVGVHIPPRNVAVDLGKQIRDVPEGLAQSAGVRRSEDEADHEQQSGRCLGPCSTAGEECESDDQKDYPDGHGHSSTVARDGHSVSGDLPIDRRHATGRSGSRHGQLDDLLVPAGPYHRIQPVRAPVQLWVPGRQLVLQRGEVAYDMPPALFRESGHRLRTDAFPARCPHDTDRNVDPHVLSGGPNGRHRHVPAVVDLDTDVVALVVDGRLYRAPAPSVRRELDRAVRQDVPVRQLHAFARVLVLPSLHRLAD